MANIRDEDGNPIQLTDELGRTVQLTDEFGRPMHLTGVATSEDSGPHAGRTAIGSDLKTHDGTHFAPTAAGGAGVEKVVPGGAEGEKQQQLGRTGSSSSSSTSSEDDGQGGRRRKKKGLMQKIKEKLPGHKNKEEKTREMVYTATTKISVTRPLGEPKPEHIRVEHHEKKVGLMDKIKDKVLPGHHH